jgi:uncharacterized OB-fold protein
MDFRILKFRPSQEPPTHANPTSTTSPMLPLVTPDTAFFWEGTAAGELRIQRCAKCGVLRHPPGPMCPACGEASDGGYTLAAGTGEVFSYVVHHHPPVPGKRLPMVVALVQLPEGVRILGEMPGVRPDQVRIGLPVRVTFTRAGDMSLPSWRSAEGALPDRVIDVTPTFVIASALATRDFQDVHHDRDLAQSHGSKDIFINILTTTGLVQKYVGDWAREAIGPDFVVRSCALRLGAPAHPYDMLVFSGEVTDDVDGVLTIDVLGKVVSTSSTGKVVSTSSTGGGSTSLSGGGGSTGGGDHVTAKVVLS